MTTATCCSCRLPCTKPYFLAVSGRLIVESCLYCRLVARGKSFNGISGQKPADLAATIIEDAQNALHQMRDGARGSLLQILDFEFAEMKHWVDHNLLAFDLPAQRKRSNAIHLWGRSGSITKLVLSAAGRLEAGNNNLNTPPTSDSTYLPRQPAETQSSSSAPTESFQYGRLLKSVAAVSDFMPYAEHERFLEKMTDIVQKELKTHVVKLEQRSTALKRRISELE